MKKKIFFWGQGAGEFSLMKPVINKSIKEGNEVYVALDAATLRILTQEEMELYQPFVFDIQNPVSIDPLLQAVNAIKPDAFVMSPSRGWQLQIPYINAGKKIAVEFNCQFNGIGESYKLSELKPDWLDYFVFASDEPFFKETLKLHYGTDKLPQDLPNKVRAFGWMGEPLKLQKRNHIFIYLGSGLTTNQGLLQKVMEALPKDEQVIAVSMDQVYGNFPNLTKVPALKDFDDALLSSKYCITHEGTATVSKAMLNDVPFVGIRGESPLKYMETEAYNILGYGKMLDRNEITAENLKPLDKTPKVKNGVDDLYKLIVE